MAATERRPNLRRATRTHNKSYREPLTESEDESEQCTPVTHRSLPLRASRAFKQSYYDSSSSSSDDTDSQESPVPPSATCRKINTTTNTTNQLKRKGDSAIFQSYKRQKSTQSTPVSRLKTTINAPRNGRIPPWQCLPYHVLLKVMQYASFPLYVGASHDTGSSRWLLETSQLCRSFHDACIGAIMHSPPLFPSDRAHHVIELLRKSARDYDGHGMIDADISGLAVSRRPLSVDYRPKVKALHIEAKHLLVKKAGINIAELLRHTPRLRTLRLYHNHDALADKHIWAVHAYAPHGHRYTYGDLFHVLDNAGIILHSFEFNGRFLVDDPHLVTLRDMCGTKPLLSLRSLVLRNLDLPYADVDKGSEKLMTWRENIAGAFAQLTDLREAAVHNCNVLDNGTLARFPSLQSLTIVNCGHVTGPGLDAYLTAHGALLKRLKLKGNQYMDLSFMRCLRVNAPSLQDLDIDLTFHDVTSFKDTEALFDELLPSGAPSWPASLESISIGPLRSLSAEDAESFYQSLVDAASDLPFLRTLELRTILSKVGWKDRAALRHKWEAKFTDTFLTRDRWPGSGRTLRRRCGTGSTEDSEIDSEQYLGRCHTVLFDLSDQRPAQDQFTEQDFLDDDSNKKDGAWTMGNVGRPKYSSRHFEW